MSDDIVSPVGGVAIASPETPSEPLIAVHAPIDTNRVLPPTPTEQDVSPTQYPTPRPIHRVSDHVISSSSTPSQSQSPPPAYTEHQLPGVDGRLVRLTDNIAHLSLDRQNSDLAVPDLVRGPDAPSPAGPSTPAPPSPVPTHFSDIPAVREQMNNRARTENRASRQPDEDDVPIAQLFPGSSVHGVAPEADEASGSGSGSGSGSSTDEDDEERRENPEDQLRRALTSPPFYRPRWQPDAEATFCPICQTQFSIFVRKHHCRKCGRVVCNTCSPHRITIPHQYIVRPPGLNPSDYDGILSPPPGGENVRLCDPCVAAPITATPPAQAPTPQTQPQSPSSQFTPRTHGHTRSRSGAGDGNHRFFVSGASGMEGSGATAGMRGRSATVHTPQTGSSTNSNRRPPVYGVSVGGAMAASEQYHDLMRSTSGRSGSSSSNHGNQRHHGHRPRLQAAPIIAEEDECPVCHRELPSRYLPSFESLREDHITECISNFGGTRPSPGNGPSSPRNQGGPSRFRRLGMFPYVATEKDCVDDAECTICLEEFVAGDKMGRLECLCRFHEACIQAWFGKHPGRCPIHQHDAFGY